MIDPKSLTPTLLTTSALHVPGSTGHHQIIWNTPSIDSMPLSGRLPETG